MRKKSLSAFLPWLLVFFVAACGREGTLTSVNSTVNAAVPSHSSSVHVGYAERDQAWLEIHDPEAAARAYPTPVPTPAPTPIPTPLQIGTPMTLSPGA